MPLSSIGNEGDTDDRRTEDRGSLKEPLAIDQRRGTEWRGGDLFLKAGNVKIDLLSRVKVNLGAQRRRPVVDARFEYLFWWLNGFALLC